MGHEIRLATSEDCRPLLELMQRIRDQAPWTWMTESQIFGVQHPETNEIVFVNIVRSGGSQYAISAYRGLEGLQGLWFIQMFDNYEILFNTPQLQAAFEDWETLDKHDRELITMTNLTFQGRGAWPLFRSFRPGYAPWYIETDEAQFLGYVLEQVLEVAPRFGHEPDLFDPEMAERCLVRTARREGDSLMWEDMTFDIDPPERVPMEAEHDPILIQAVQKLPRTRYTVEAEVFMAFKKMGKRKERPLLSLYSDALGYYS